MDDKVGVFICTGYGIAEALDVDALCEVATGEFSVPFCKTVESCEGASLEGINADIQAEGLNKVVIAGISRRVPRVLEARVPAACHSFSSTLARGQ